MRKLITGQTIRVDNHKSGTREPVEWGQGIHLDKTINDKKGKGVRFKIYLDSDRGIEFVGNSNDEDRRYIINEVSKILGKNPQKRKEFVEDMIKEIDRFSQTMSPESRRLTLRDGANRIAKHFELDRLEVEIENNVNQCLTEHYDTENKVCYILQDLREKTIIVGENLELVRDKNLFSKISD